jgi:hypothetical protein
MMIHWLCKKLTLIVHQHTLSDQIDKNKILPHSHTIHFYFTFFNGKSFVWLPKPFSIMIESSCSNLLCLMITKCDS